MEDRDVAPQRPQAQVAPQAAKPEPGWSKFFTGNATLSAWLVFLGFGGALLSHYYRSLCYFPQIEWKESLSYLAALSILGGIVTVLYGMLLFIPGVIWSEFLIHDPKLETNLCSEGCPTQPCFRTVGLSVGLPFLAFMLVMHLAALAPWWAIVSCAVVSLAVVSVVQWIRFSRLLDARKDLPQETRQSLLLKYAIAFDVSAVLSLSSMLVLYELTGIPDRLRLTSPMIYLCTAMVTIANFFVAVQFRHARGGAVLTAIVSALILLGSGEALDGRRAAISARVMHGFGFGLDTHVTLVVNKKARDVLDALELRPEHPAEDIGIVRDARMLSRLGAEYLVQIGARRVAIPRDQVLGWSVSTGDSSSSPKK